jgi:hypothetical protein
MTGRAELPPRLRDLLGAVGARVGIEDAGATGIVWTKWTDVVGDAIAAHAEPTSLKRGVLRVRATSPTWATELTYLATQIRARANEIAGREIVREVRIWTGPGAVSRATTSTPKATLYDHSPDASAGRSPSAPGDDPEDLGSALIRARDAWLKRRSKPG